MKTHTLDVPIEMRILGRFIVEATHRSEGGFVEIRRFDGSNKLTKPTWRVRTMVEGKDCTVSGDNLTDTLIRMVGVLATVTP